MPPSAYNVPSPSDQTRISCLYCGKEQEVGARAMSVTSKFCHKSLQLEDVRIKEYRARRSIDTLGTVTVEKKGNVVADRIHCGAMIVRGKVKGHITSRGPVLIGPESEVTGDVTAPTLAVGAGAILDGKYAIGQQDGQDKTG
jgi:hypothetical protein